MHFVSNVNSWSSPASWFFFAFSLSFVVTCYLIVVVSLCWIERMLLYFLLHNILRAYLCLRRRSCVRLRWALSLSFSAVLTPLHSTYTHGKCFSQCSVSFIISFLHCEFQVGSFSSSLHIHIFFLFASILYYVWAQHSAALSGRAMRVSNIYIFSLLETFARST